MYLKEVGKMNIEITDNMRNSILETINSEMNIVYLLERTELTEKERSEITREYLKRLFGDLNIRTQVQDIGQRLMSDILDTE